MENIMSKNAGWLAAGLGGVLGMIAWAGDEPVVLRFDAPETAGISGFRAMWDTPVVLSEDGVTAITDDKVKDKWPTAVWRPEKRDKGAKSGALAFDAIHRSLLVRFPGTAEAVAGQMAKGFAVVKAELVLPFRDTELFPPGHDMNSSNGEYDFRKNWGVADTWRALPPQWHAVAWALRKPWTADATRGPTYNAYINGAGYWAKYGAQDERQDRFPERFGPAEVSHAQTTGRVDVTAAFTNAAFGATPAARLRTVTDCGFLMRKWETYDHRFFRDNDGAYEWATGTGGRGILIHPPRLEVTFVPAPGVPAAGKLPPAADVAALAVRLKADGKGGAPTAVLPTADALRAFAERFNARPAWMPDWQWQRVQELLTVTPRGEIGAQTRPFWYLFVSDHAINANGADREDIAAVYALWVDEMLGKQFRGWYGFDAAELLLTYYAYGEAMPEPVREHWRHYWTAWAMDEIPTSEILHCQSGSGVPGEKASDWYARKKDWRGGRGFFRGGYNYHMSTMNFNNMAANGALLGGFIAGSERAMTDGRYGLEHFPLRLWSWYDGTTQESIDHYYLAHTMVAQKIAKDFAPTQFDRMMGLSMLSKSVDELVSTHHPFLRRFIYTSTRTGLGNVFLCQDGTKHIVHALSHGGALSDLSNTNTAGMPVTGGAPKLIGMEALVSPWGPDWMANYVDEKPLPFRMTASFRMWGSYRLTPLYRRTYMSRHYGLASQDFSTGGEAVPIVAMWQPTDKPAVTVPELRALLVRYGANGVNFLQSGNGVVGAQGGSTSVLQHDNTMVVLASPNLWPRGDVKSLQASVGIVAFTDTPGWELRVDGRKVEALPVSIKAGQRVTIKDGVTYLSLIPLPSTDLGRKDEVVISAGYDKDVPLQGGGAGRMRLLFDQYNYRSDAALDTNKTAWAKVRGAYGGFLLKLGDATQYATFEAFQREADAATAEARWEDAEGVLHVVCKSGGDTFELGYRPGYEADQRGAPRTDFAYRRVNGQDPYLPDGIDRDSSLTQQGTTGRLEKNGAVLTCEPGRMAFLQTEPKTGTFAGFNPLPDTTEWMMSVPGAVRVEADGKVGLLRAIVNPGAGTLDVDYGVRPDQESPDMATALLVFGLKKAPAVMRDGKPAAHKLDSVAIDGETAWVVPLPGKPVKARDAAERYRQRRAARQAAFGAKTELGGELKYEKGQEDYLLTMPRSGTYRFQRLFPMPSAHEARIPEGLRVALDGRLSILRLELSRTENRVALYYPFYGQEGFEERARAMLVFGTDEQPKVVVNGTDYEGPIGRAEIGGEKAWVIPLFGETPEQVAPKLAERVAAGRARL
jgi:hypothetical protein